MQLRTTIPATLHTLSTEPSRATTIATHPTESPQLVVSVTTTGSKRPPDVPMNNTEKKQKEDTSIYIEDDMDAEIEMKKLGKPSIDNYYSIYIRMYITIRTYIQLVYHSVYMLMVNHVAIHIIPQVIHLGQ